MSPPGEPGRRPRQVPCPRCAAPSEFSPANRFRPFCSERCKNADLGAWASEHYRVEAPPPSAEDADDTAGT
jgi:endogenous inhibitor of DNA gyrase (YacG/DUF329 family)